MTAPRKCSKCRKAIHWVMENTGDSLAPLVAKTIIDDNRHFHIGAWL